MSTPWEEYKPRPGARRFSISHRQRGDVCWRPECPGCGPRHSPMYDVSGNIHHNSSPHSRNSHKRAHHIVAPVCGNTDTPCSPAVFANCWSIFLGIHHSSYLLINFCVSTPQWMDIGAASTFWQLSITLPGTLAYEVWCELTFSFLGYVTRSRTDRSHSNDAVTMCNLWGNARLLSTVANECCFKLPRFGEICYTAIDN